LRREDEKVEGTEEGVDFLPWKRPSEMKTIGDFQSLRDFEKLVPQFAGARNGQIHLRKVGDQLEEELLVLLRY
jgi:hypothetical protein